MITLTINGKHVSAEDDATILQAAKSNGIKIPNLCYDKRLRPYGGCRLCVVEVEGQPRLFASCSTPAAPGMVVTTETPKLRKARQTVLELLLVHHPLDCPVCDKAGECDLQDLAYEYGKPEGRFVRHRKTAPPDVRGPLIELTSNRCILCGKCVRLCHEHQRRGALGLIGRGFSTVVQPAFGEVLECDYCGQCVDACPTGALLNKPYKFKARAWFLEEKDTTCPFCGCGCTLTLGMREGTILRSRGKEDNGRSKGNLCGRGRFGFDYIYSEHRLKTPLMRKNQEFIPITWDEALTSISDRLKQIVHAFGSESVGAIGSARCTNEDNYLLKKFMVHVIGSRNIDSSASFGYARVQEALNRAFGAHMHRIDLQSPLGKDVILIVESDLSISHPVFGLNILKAKTMGSRLIVADARETKLTKNSSRHMRIKEGTSVAFLNGIMKVIIDKELFNREIIAKTPGFSAFQDSLQHITLDSVAKSTGIDPEDLISAAEEIARAKRRMISCTLMPTENTKGMDSILAAANLIILLGDERDALQIPAEYANTYGMYKVGIRPDHDYPRVKNMQSMLYEPGTLKALIMMGEDAASALPDSAKIIKTLKSLDLFVVLDIAMTATAKYAHIILPASSWAEKDGTFINAEGIMQDVHRVVNSPGQAVPDWKILRNLSLTMGMDIAGREVKDITDEIDKHIREEDTVYTKRVFHALPYVMAEEPDHDYPLALVTRDVLQHSGTMSTRSKALDLVVSEAILEISESDAKKYGIIDNSHVKISSRQGSVYLKAKISDALSQGTVFTSLHFPHGRVNALTGRSDNGNAHMNAIKIEAVKI